MHYTVNELTGCHEWNLSRDKDGYGRVRYKGKEYRAHRLSYMQATGEELGRWDIIMHTCDNPCCVNPKHLVKGTPKENMEDCKRKGRLGPRGAPRGTQSRRRTGMEALLQARDDRARKVLRAKGNPTSIAKRFGLRLSWVLLVLRGEYQFSTSE